MTHRFTFTVSEAAYLQANRLNYWSAVRSGTLGWRFGSIFAFYFIIAIAVNYLNYIPFSQIAWFTILGVTLLAAAAVLLFCYGLGYFLLPRRTRKLFVQQKFIHLVQHFEVTDEAFISSSDLSTARLTYAMVHKWVENSHIFLIYLSDNTFIFLPVEIAGNEAIDAIRANLIAVGRPGKRL